jgi:hypothetical protein
MSRSSENRVETGHWQSFISEIPIPIIFLLWSMKVRATTMIRYAVTRRKNDDLAVGFRVRDLYNE